MRWLLVIAFLGLLSACGRARTCTGDLVVVTSEATGSDGDAGPFTSGIDTVVGHGGCREFMTDEIEHHVTLGDFEVTYTLYQYKGQTTMSAVPAKLKDPACGSVLEFTMPPGCELALTGDRTDHRVVCRRFPQGGVTSVDLDVLRFRRK